MSTLTAPQPVGATAAPAHTHVAHGRVTFAGVARSEWIKFRTLRSSWATLGAAFAGLIGIAAIIGYKTSTTWATLAPEDSAPSGPLQSHFLAQLLIGVLGVLFVTGEYGTGMIRSTLAAVPRRVPVLLAKTLVFGTLALVSMVVGSVLAFLAAQAFLSAHGHGTSLGDPGVLRVVLGTGVYLALVGLLGSAVGWLVRSTAGGISTLLGALLVLPLLLSFLPGSWGTDATKYLPGQAGSSFITSVHVPGTLAPWTGLGVLALWVVAATVAAAVVLRRRDG